MEYAHGSGPYWHWIIPFLFMVLMVVCAARMRPCMGRWRRHPERRTGGIPRGWRKPEINLRTYCWAESPREILGRRYASGAITKDQYEQLNSDIKASFCGHDSGQQDARNNQNRPHDITSEEEGATNANPS